MTREKRSGSLGSLGEKLLELGFRPTETIGKTAKKSLKAKPQDASHKSPKKGKAKAPNPKRGRKRKYPNADRYLKAIERQKTRQGQGREQELGLGHNVMVQSESEPKQDLPEDILRHLEGLSLTARPSRPIENLAPSDADISEIATRYLRANEFFENDRSFSNGVEEEVAIGFDLGSTTSKLVARFPYNPTLGAHAIPAPNGFRADGHPYYWKTLIYEQPDGTMSLHQAVEGKALTQFKQDFLSLSKRGRLLSETGTVETVTTFMALMLKQSIGWLVTTLSQTLADRRVNFSANFGFPAELADSEDAMDVFRTCGQAALALACSSSSITRQSVRDTLRDVKENGSDLEVAVVPEFVGAVLGYFQSARGRPGKYLLCDYGGLTCDCVLFGFGKPSEGESRISIFSAKVRNLGSDVLDTAVEKGFPLKSLRHALSYFARHPVIDAYPKIGPHSPIWKGDLPLFQIGGGRSNPAYEGIFALAEKGIKKSNYATHFQRYSLDLGEAEGVDTTLTVGRNSSRLLVALGLSWSVYDMPEWVPSSQIREFTRAEKVDIAERYIGSESM